VDHFTTGSCKGKDYKVQILEKINKKGTNADGKMNKETASLRRQREVCWMKELRTVYPYGLNNRCDTNRDQRSLDDNLYKKMTRKKKNNRHRSKKTSHMKPGMTSDELLQKLKTADAHSIVNIIHQTIPQMNKVELRKCGKLLLDYDEHQHDDPINERIKNIIEDMIFFKIGYKKSPGKEKSKKDLNPLVVCYQNPAVGYIKLQDILRLSDVKSCIDSHCDLDITVVYKYTSSIRNKLFNYKDMMQDVDIHVWDDNQQKCECNTTFKDYQDTDHGHVITGNLNIIPDKELRNLFKKGPNFRERNSINFTTAKSEIVAGLDEYIKKWSNRTGKVQEIFNEWKQMVLENVDVKIKQLQKGTLKNWRQTHKVLTNKKSVDILEMLQTKFVIVPIDKASNNIGFVCKKYMISTIIKEVKTNTYDELGDITEVLQTQVEECIKAKWCVPLENQKLPVMYATIKMHKKPTKFRYIIAAKRCVSKNVAKELTKILKLIMKMMVNYCDKIKAYTGVNRMWITESSKDVLQDMEKLNVMKKARSISTFDFSTLYTKIDTEDLKEKLKWVVEKAFCGGSNQWIRVHGTGAKFDNGTKKKSGKLYTKDSIHEMIEFIIDNAIFSVGNRAYRQIIGIPMGTDPAPFMANLYLFYYEFQYMTRLTDEDFGVAKRFYGHTKRFIDDLVTLNNNSHLEENWKNIYPHQLVLNKENEEDSKASFLDIDIQIKCSCFDTKIYDKRDAFNFDIINYPDIKGNIPENPAYGVCVGQLLRIGRNTTNIVNFVSRAKLLITKLLNKGYNRQRLRKVSRKCLVRHDDILLKYDTTEKDLLHMIFDL